MGLEFICGSAGSGKSTYLYRQICDEAAAHRERNYYILVPDQFTLETQKTLVEMSGEKGILNIDVLSFHRLAFRAFEQFPAEQKTILEDMGKTMLLGIPGFCAERFLSASMMRDSSPPEATRASGLSGWGENLRTSA